MIIYYLISTPFFLLDDFCPSFISVADTKYSGKKKQFTGEKVYFKIAHNFRLYATTVEKLRQKLKTTDKITFIVKSREKFMHIGSLACFAQLAFSNDTHLNFHS